jgi:hypothetical protein
MSLNPAYKNADLQNNELVIKSTGAMVSQFVAPQKNRFCILNGQKGI